MTKEELRQALAASVGRLMDERDWTQPELAKEADIAQSHVSRILSGEQSIGLDVIAAVADAFDVEPWELLMDEEATRRSVLERILRPKPAAEPRHVAHRKRKRKGNNGKSSD